MPGRELPASFSTGSPPSSLPPSPSYAGGGPAVGVGLGVPTPAGGPPIHYRRPPVHVHVRGEPGVMYLVQYRRVTHLPAPPRGAPQHHPFLCPAFSRAGVCPAGVACPDVHADTSAARRITPHLREWPADVARQRSPGSPSPFQWRFPATLGTLTIAVSPTMLAASRSHAADPTNAAAGNDGQATALVSLPASDCLHTRALAEGARSPPSVCVHFMRKGVCDFGAACSFVHPLSLADSTAVPAGQPHRSAHSGAPSVVVRRYNHDPYEARGWREATVSEQRRRRSGDDDGGDGDAQGSHSDNS